MRHRLSAALVLALLSLGVTACSDDSDPEAADPTDSGTPTASSSAPTSDPPSTSATPKPEPESASKFIRRWFDVADKMQVSGDTDDYLSLAAPGCKPCFDTAELIAGYYEAGGDVSFDGTEITRVRSIGTIGASSEFRVDVTSAPTRYRERAGAPLKSLDGGPSSVYLKLEKTSDGWLVLKHGIYAQ